MKTIATYSQSDELCDTMYELLKRANNPSLAQEPIDPKASKSPQDDEHIYPGIVNDRKEAIKMLDWMVKASPVLYAKEEAEKVLKFLDALNNPGFDRSLINKEVFIPTLYDIDRIATHLCLYRNNKGIHLNHNLMVSDLEMLLKALRDYKDYFASITPNETITRWETAIAKRRQGTSTLSNPELEIAIQQALDSEQKNQTA